MSRVLAALLFVCVGLCRTRAQDRAPEAPGIEFRAVVTVASRLPDPAKAPYKDCLTQIKVRLLAPVEQLSLAKNGEALLVFWAFQDRKPEPGSQIRVGHEISARVLPYAVVEASLSQTMRMDETNDFQSQLFWVNSFKITGGTPQELPEATPLPARAGAPNPKPAAQVKGAVDRILRVLQAYGGETAIDPSTQLLSDRTLTLWKKNFWVLEKPTASKRIYLPPLDAVEDFHRQLKERGIELVMVFPPAVASVYPDYIANVPWKPGRDGRVDRHFLEFADEIRKLGVTVVDVWPELYENRFIEGPDGRLHTIYYPLDQHWSPMGAKIAAGKVAETLKRQPWFARYVSEEKPRPFVYTEEVELSSPWSSWLGTMPAAARDPQPIPPLASRIIPAPESPTIEEMRSPAAPIYVIGDSFSWMGQDQHSSFSDHLIAATGLPIDQAVMAASATGASLQSFARTARLSEVKVVVWEVAMILTAGEIPLWGRVLLDRSSVLPLYDHFSAAKLAGAKVVPVGEATAKFIAYRALAADLTGIPQPDPARPATASILWPAIKLGKNPVLVTPIGLKNRVKPDLGPDPDGVEFIVRVDRKKISTSKHTQDGWFTAEVDLSAFAEKTVSIELVVSSMKNTAQDIAYWGEPEIWEGEIVPQSSAAPAVQAGP